MSAGPTRLLSVVGGGSLQGEGVALVGLAPDEPPVLPDSPYGPGESD